MSDPAADAPQPDHTAEPAPAKPDPSQALDHLKETVDHLKETVGHAVSLIEGLAAVIPQAHGFGARLAAMREAFDRFVFHSTPPA